MGSLEFGWVGVKTKNIGITKATKPTTTPNKNVKPLDNRNVDGEMVGENKPVKSQLPLTREELRKDLESKGFKRTGTSSSRYETWKKDAQGGEGQITVNIKPDTGEVIRTQKVWKSDKSGKYSERQDYFGNRLPDQSHTTGHYVK